MDFGFKWFCTSYKIHIFFYTSVYVIQPWCCISCFLVHYKDFVCFSDDRFGSSPYRAIIHQHPVTHDLVTSAVGGCEGSWKMIPALVWRQWPVSINTGRERYLLIYLQTWPPHRSSSTARVWEPGDFGHIPGRTHSNISVFILSSALSDLICYMSFFKSSM